MACHPRSVKEMSKNISVNHKHTKQHNIYQFNSEAKRRCSLRLYTVLVFQPARGLQFKCYRRLCSDMQRRLLQFLLHWNRFAMTWRDFVSCWGDVVWLTTKLFPDGHNRAESCTDCFSKFHGLSLAVCYRHHRSVQPKGNTQQWHAHTSLICTVIFISTATDVRRRVAFLTQFMTAASSP